MPKLLDLAGSPQLSLTRAMGMLRQFASTQELEHLHLGGGTALAMRWRHRHSTDVDLAMPAPFGERLVAKHGPEVNEALARLRQKGAIKPRYFFAGRTGSWHYVDSGPVSLSLSNARFNPDELDREAETGTPVAPTFSILRGKLIGRVIGGGRLLARDGYDLACAFRCEPAIAEALVQEAERTEPAQFAALRRTVKVAGRRIIIGRPLIEAAHPEVAQDPWGCFVQEVERVLSAEPESAERLDGPRPGRN